MDRKGKIDLLKDVFSNRSGDGSLIYVDPEKESELIQFINRILSYLK